MHIGIDEDAGRYTAHGGDNPPILCDGVLEAHLPPVDLPAYRSSLIGAWRERGEVQKDSWASRGSRRRMLTGSIAVDGLYAPVGKIGRASCRERGQMSVDEVSSQRRRRAR